MPTMTTTICVAGTLSAARTAADQGDSTVMLDAAVEHERMASLVPSEAEGGSKPAREGPG